MSLLRKLFSNKSREVAIRNNIADTKASLSRLEALTLELEKHDIVMKEHEKLFTMVTNDLDYPLWIKDINGRFLFMNGACIREILRTTQDAALLLTDEDFEHDALAKVCVVTDQIVIKTGKTHRFIEHARYGDGSDLWLESTKSILIMSDNIVGQVGFGKNITDLVPDEVKEKYKEPGFVEIPINLLYNPNDIEGLIETNRTVEQLKTGE